MFLILQLLPRDLVDFSFNESSLTFIQSHLIKFASTSREKQMHCLSLFGSTWSARLRTYSSIMHNASAFPYSISSIAWSILITAPFEIILFVQLECFWLMYVFMWDSWDHPTVCRFLNLFFKATTSLENDICRMKRINNNRRQHCFVSLEIMYSRKNHQFSFGRMVLKELIINFDEWISLFRLFLLLLFSYVPLQFGLAFLLVLLLIQN